MVPDAILPFDKLCTAPLPALTPKLKINKAYKPSVTNFIVFGSLENTPTTRLIGPLKSCSNL
jgi:hypothetical protein